MDLIGYFAAFLMGLTLGVIGGGGSILTVPILVYFFGMNGIAATTGSLFVVGTTAFVGAILNARHGHVDFKTSFLLAIPGMVGVFATRSLALPLIPDSFILPIVDLRMTKSNLVLTAFSVLMLMASWAMLQSKPSGHQGARQNSALNTVSKGFLVGIVTGFVGAGGGFLIIPTLVLLLRLSMKMAVGTSLAIIALNSFFGFAISFDSGQIDWRLLISIAALGVIGLLVGSRISILFPERRLKQAFGIFVLVLGLFIFLEQTRQIAHLSQ